MRALSCSLLNQMAGVRHRHRNGVLIPAKMTVTPIPLEGKESGKLSSSVGAKLPTEFPASVTQPSICSADLDLSFAEVSANGRATGLCEPSQPLTQLALSALTGHSSGTEMPRRSFRISAIRASRSILHPGDSGFPPLMIGKGTGFVAIFNAEFR
jgi:hypothetical protein